MTHNLHLFERLASSLTTIVQNARKLHTATVLFLHVGINFFFLLKKTALFLHDTLYRAWVIAETVGLLRQKNGVTRWSMSNSFFQTRMKINNSLLVTFSFFSLI